MSKESVTRERLVQQLLNYLKLGELSATDVNDMFRFYSGLGAKGDRVKQAVTSSFDQGELEQFYEKVGQLMQNCVGLKAISEFLNQTTSFTMASITVGPPENQLDGAKDVVAGLMRHFVTVDVLARSSESFGDLSRPKAQDNCNDIAAMAQLARTLKTSLYVLDRIPKVLDDVDSNTDHNKMISSSYKKLTTKLYSYVEEVASRAKRSKPSEKRFDDLRAVLGAVVKDGGCSLALDIVKQLGPTINTHRTLAARLRQCLSGEPTATYKALVECIADAEPGDLLKSAPDHQVKGEINSLCKSCGFGQPFSSDAEQDQGQGQGQGQGPPMGP